MVEFGRQPAPLVHASRHEDDGDDEVSVDGLAGELEDSQPSAPHGLAGSKHNAATLAELNEKVSDATLDKAGDAREPEDHASKHESGGDDEISVAGLTGATALAILGDATAGRVIRCLAVLIDNGSSGVSLACDTMPLFNCTLGVHEDDIAKSGSTAHFALDANGYTLTLDVSSEMGNVVAIIAYSIHGNNSATVLTCNCLAWQNNIEMVFQDASSGTQLDLTTLVDIGMINIDLTFLTAA